MFFRKVYSFSSASALVLLLAVASTTNALVIPPAVVTRRANSIAQSMINARSSLPLTIRDVWAPNITMPNSSTVWDVNSHADIMWDATNPPAQITNPNGTLFLGHLDDKGSENLDLDHPLASYVNLSLGKATIQVPDVPTGKYIVVLMGDSGNRSPEFMIQSGSGGAANSTTTNTSSTPTDSSSATATDPPNTIPTETAAQSVVDLESNSEQ